MVTGREQNHHMHLSNKMTELQKVKAWVKPSQPVPSSACDSWSEGQSRGTRIARQRWVHWLQQYLWHLMVQSKQNSYSPAKLTLRPSLTAAPISALLGIFNIPHSGRFSTPPPVDRTSSQTIDRSNRSMNCWSTALDFGVEKRRYLSLACIRRCERTYSSNIEVRDQDWRRRIQPIKQPVRCFCQLEWLESKLELTLPLLQCISIGWLRLSSIATSAEQMTSSGILSNGSC